LYRIIWIFFSLKHSIDTMTHETDQVYYTIIIFD